MTPQNGISKEHANGTKAEGESKPEVAPTTPSSNPGSPSMLQSTAGQPSSSIANTSPMTDRENGGPPNNQSDQSEHIGDPKVPLEDFDWADLEKRYHDKMEESRETENEICEEFGKWVRVCSFSHCSADIVLICLRCLRHGLPLLFITRTRDPPSGTMIPLSFLTGPI